MSPSAQSGQHGLAPHTPDLKRPQQRAGQPGPASGGAPDSPGQRLPQAYGAGIPPGPHGHQQRRASLGCGLPGQHGPGQEGQHLAPAGRVLHLARHKAVRQRRPLLPRPPAPGNRDPGEVSAEGEEAHGQCLMQDLLFSNRVVACYDDVKKGACKRKDCKFYHPPNHLKNVVHTNGRNNLRMR